jgi:hypothetical protein
MAFAKPASDTPARAEPRATPRPSQPARFRQPARTSPTRQRNDYRSAEGAKRPVVESTACWRTQAVRPLIHRGWNYVRLRTGKPPTLVRARDYVALPPGRTCRPWTTPSLPWTRADRATWTRPVRWSGRGPNRLPWPAWTKPVRWSSPSWTTPVPWSSTTRTKPPVGPGRLDQPAGPAPAHPACNGGPWTRHAPTAQTSRSRPMLRLPIHRQTRPVQRRWTSPIPSGPNLSRPRTRRPLVQRAGPSAWTKAPWSTRATVRGAGPYGWSRSLVQPAQDQRSGGVAQELADQTARAGGPGGPVLGPGTGYTETSGADASSVRRHPPAAPRVGNDRGPPRGPAPRGLHAVPLLLVNHSSRTSSASRTTCAGVQGTTTPAGGKRRAV